MTEVGIDASAGVDLTPGEWRRIHTQGSRSRNGAYIVRPGLKGGVMVTFKNHSTGESANWWSDSRLIPTYATKLNPPARSPKPDYFRKTKVLWDTLDDTSGAHSPYLKSKQVPSFRITRYSPGQRVTLIPIHDRYGK